MALNQPLLTSALNQLYDNILDHDDENLKKEKSATQAFLLLSSYHRHTANPYYLRKIEEVWNSLKSSENKWRDDLWQPSLVKFAYEKEKFDKDDATKVLKTVISTWATNNSEYPKDVNITNIIALKDALLTSNAHINHVSAYEFILKGCPLISQVSNPKAVPEISEILHKVFSSLPNHISPITQLDPLYGANNFFSLVYLKMCQKQFLSDLRVLDRDLMALEYSEPDQDRIMRHVTSHHNYAGFLQELGSLSMDWKTMRRTQMRIARKFTEICRSRFLANYPTAMLFMDIDEQLEVHDIDIESLPEIASMLGAEWQEDQPSSYFSDEEGEDYDEEEEEHDEEDEEYDEDEAEAEDDISGMEYETKSEGDVDMLEGYDVGEYSDKVMSSEEGETHGEADEAEEENNTIS